MPGSPFRPRFALALAWGLVACGAADAPGGEAEAVVQAMQLPPRPGAARQGQADVARASVDALVATPTPAALLAVLGQGHGVARALLGRHTLKYEAEFSLVPAEPARPAVDEPVSVEQKVKDALSLQWASGPAEPVRFFLSQQTDNNRGRDLMVLDELAYTRALHRGWHVRPLDSDLHLRWLDEAQRSVHDVVELAAPALSVTATVEGDVVQVQLGLAAEAVPRPSRPEGVPADPGRAWREQATITAIEGQLTLELATGLWQSAAVHVRYSLRDALGRGLLGETHLTGTAARAPDLEVVAPEHVQPLPERVRYEAERRRLLDGLAGA